MIATPPSAQPHVHISRPKHCSRHAPQRVVSPERPGDTPITQRPVPSAAPALMPQNPRMCLPLHSRHAELPTEESMPQCHTLVSPRLHTCKNLSPGRPPWQPHSQKANRETTRTLQRRHPARTAPGLPPAPRSKRAPSPRRASSAAQLQIPPPSSAARVRRGNTTRAERCPRPLLQLRLHVADVGPQLREAGLNRGVVLAAGGCGRFGLPASQPPPSNARCHGLVP